MANPDALSAGVTAVSRFYVGDITLEETLDRVAHLALESIAGAEIVGVSMLLPGRPRTTVITDGMAFEMEGTQYESGIGPGAVTMRTQRVQRVDWIDRDRRWLAFSQAASAVGIVSSLSFPLIAHGDGIGVLSCYSHCGGAFCDDAEFIGSDFASAAAIALANAQAYWDARHLSERLGSAMRSQATIEQAKGILIAERRCRPDQALAIMVGVSERENVAIADIADQIVGHCWQAIETVPSDSADVPAERSR